MVLCHWQKKKITIESFIQENKILKFFYNFAKKKKIDYSNNKQFEYDFDIVIEKSNRRTVSLVVKNGKLFLKCPINLENIEVNNILKKKNNWIRKKVEFQKQKIYELEKKIEENKILFKGKEKIIKFYKYKKELIFLKSEEIIIFCNSKNIVNKTLEKWLKKESTIFIEQRINYFSNKMKLNFNQLKVKELKSKWGSCQYLKKIIIINWRLIMAPTSVIDYVIVHELCHLIQPNHSEKFWIEVKKYKSDYFEDKLWLKEKGFLVLNLGASERI